MANNRKLWNDQPDQVTTAPVVCETSIRGATFEVRKTEGGGRYWVSVGNLFGSETIDCGTDADLVFKLMHKFNPDKPQGLPAGATLMEA